MVQALESNRDLAVAALRVEAARYELSVARSEYLPSLNAAFSVGAESTAQERNVYNFALQPTVSWNVSLFGALKHTKRESQANILASEWSYRGVLLSLTKEVAESYFTLSQATQSLQIARHSLVLREKQAQLISQMQQQGFASSLALEQAQSLVFMARADVEKYERAVVQGNLSLSMLLGIMPRGDLVQSSLLSVDNLPALPKVGVPSDVLNQRPDIMESYYDLQAAAARVGIARSNRFPTISLTGSGGLISAAAQRLFANGDWEWSATAGITQPIFSFRRLKRNEQIARSEYEQAVKSYEQTVISAVEEVESALVYIATLKEQIASYDSYVASNKQIADLTQALYDQGFDDYLDVISTAQTWYESQLSLIALVAQQYINYADLVMALGDGWQDLASEKN
jgi:multidrug efflux system outer membrane protein